MISRPSEVLAHRGCIASSVAFSFGAAWRESGFAKVQAQGPRRIYELDPAPMAEVDQWLSRFRRFWEPKLDALALEVERGKRRRT